MLHGPSTSSHPRSANTPAPAISTLDDSNPIPFICVSSNLRRLLMQAEITAPRLHFAAIEGEAGVGKHLLAQNIHRQSSVAAQPFRRRDAREWLANEAEASALTGTLYLDRVDLLASHGQGLLLSLIKALQTDAPSTPHFLLLVSSHTALRQLASQGHFLPDLAFRLTAVHFFIPPLHEHREDIAPIAQALIDRICRRYQQPTAVLASGTLPRLLQHPWSGNVRELASVLESAILDSSTGIIRPADLTLAAHTSHTLGELSPSQAAASPASAQLTAEVTRDLTLDTAVHRHIQLVLDLNRGNKLRTARQLGISRSTLYRLLSGASLSPQTTLAS